MVILKTVSEVKNLLAKQKTEGRSIGFVPTMGALHAGHISLVETSKSDNDFTIVSVFVNPTQFNNPDDLKKYPRTEEEDIKTLKDAGTDAVFFPTATEIYPNGEESAHFDFNGLENQMEGEFRPGHFDGVGTVVKRLFEITTPDRAYFGEKDFQQLRIIQQMVKSEKLTVEIVPVPIKREKDGLAMSSRNMRLSKEMREEAVAISRILLASKEYLNDHSITETKKFAEEEFAKTKLGLEYFEIANEENLLPAKRKSTNKKIRAFVAAFADDIRLIDNMSLN